MSSTSTPPVFKSHPLLISFASSPTTIDLPLTRRPPRASESSKPESASARPCLEIFALLRDHSHQHPSSDLHLASFGQTGRRECGGRRTRQCFRQAGTSERDGSTRRVLGIMRGLGCKYGLRVRLAARTEQRGWLAAQGSFAGSRLAFLPRCSSYRFR